MSFPPHDLPAHSGWFNVRVHLMSNYGAPDAQVTLYMRDAPISTVKRLLLFLVLLLAVWGFQHVLNQKGTCSFVDPLQHADVIDDAFVRATAWINRFLLSSRLLVRQCKH